MAAAASAAGRALAAAAAGCRVAGRSSSAFLGSCRREAHNYSMDNQTEEEQNAGGAAKITAAEAEAALNSKNVEGLHEEETEAGTERTWVPDRGTGVFAPADKTGTGVHSRLSAAPTGATAGASRSPVLEQTVFVRDVDMEDVERPSADIAIGIGNGNGNGADGKQTD